MDEIEFKKTSKERKEQIYKGIKIGHSWSFKRYGNLPLIYDLIHGIVAGTFAELTNGIINTEDLAWESSIFPANYKEFFSSFFVPQTSTTLENRNRIEGITEYLRHISLIEKVRKTLD